MSASAGASEPVIRLEGLCHRYGARRALRDVELAIPAARTIALIGPDGVGKSTLLGLAAGARKVQTGRVHTLGRDMRRGRERARVCERIAYMPQGLGRNLYPDLSVRENLDFFGRLFGQPRPEREERIRMLLAATGLSAFGDRHARKLSGGMRQKLGLCCALTHDPEVLILDEPTTGVDPLARRQFWELVDGLRERRPGLSVIVATAYMEEAERFDWIVAMNDGRVLATGTPDELKERGGAESLEAAFVALLPERRRQPTRRPRPARREAEAEIAIEARDLTKRFDHFTAVDSVSFRIRRGEIFGFLGSNGCGKTTTMKMLTGLLPASEGEAWLFGQPIDARDRSLRRRVGFMSQSFSLYNELSVRRNLHLHARLFHVPAEQIAARVQSLLERFELTEVADQLADALPLGLKQRLSLAVAMIHEPETLILDEPTSGVDPIARDRFWELLIDLSRSEGVTIFLSTHFMNEAERCDRISLMHAGRVLAEGTPEEIVRAQASRDLEEAFGARLAEALRAEAPPELPIPTLERAAPRAESAHTTRLRRAWAYAVRESRELLRDPIRLAYALVGPLIMLIAIGFGITFDVEHLSYAALDRDDSVLSRRYLEGLAGSAYFREGPPLRDYADLETRLRRGELKVALEIPPGFGRDLLREAHPRIGVWIDGAMPFSAEVVRGYLEGVHARFLEEWTTRELGNRPEAAALRIEPRFRYNQEFESVYAIVPGVICLVLIMIPSIMTALGVVREKELGSITNLYVTPVTRLEFLAGKQLPYVALSFLSFLVLLATALGLFGVPVKGCLPGLAFGALLYVGAATAWGLFVSTFVRTQIAAVFGTAIVSSLPAIQFSGLLQPVSSLAPVARAMGRAFPSSYFQQISLGSFTKGLGASSLVGEYLALAVFIALFLTLARLRLRPQAR